MVPFSWRTRAEVFKRQGPFDLIVIGGGITGAGVLRDAAQRGLQVLLLEKGDFASGTSSKSSKLVHGGLRYLREYEFGLTRESCLERNLLIRQNPHLVRPIPFVYPIFKGDPEGPKMVRAGMWLYELLGAFKNYQRHRMLKPAQTLELVPDLRADGLRGAAFYYDAAVDDARLTLENIKSGVAYGGEALNYAPVIGFRYTQGRISGVVVRDLLDWKTYEMDASVVVNATGVWTDRVRSLDSPRGASLSPTKGVHVVIPSSRIQQKATLAFKSFQDDRQMFAIPWGDVTILGTTDTFFNGDPDLLTSDRSDIRYILDACNNMFPRARLTREDIISVFVGLRPLIAAQGATSAGAISREHQIFEDDSGLMSMAGGKLTTYRLMARELLERAVRLLPKEKVDALRPCRTEDPIAGAVVNVPELTAHLVREGVAPATASHLISSYGPLATAVLELAKQVPGGMLPLVTDQPCLRGEVVYAVRHESALRITDLFERRIRLALWSRGQGEAALEVASLLMAQELEWSEEQKRVEIGRYADSVKNSYQEVPT